MIPIRKHRLWLDEMNAALEKRVPMPFQRGVNDCVMFVADIVLAYTSVDLAAPFRGKYHTWAGAVAIMQGRTVSEWVDQVCEEAGMIRVPPEQVSRGDLVLTMNLSFNSVAVCDGPGAVGMGESGILRVPRDRFSHGWRILPW